MRYVRATMFSFIIFICNFLIIPHQNNIITTVHVNLEHICLYWQKEKLILAETTRRSSGLQLTFWKDRSISDSYLSSCRKLEDGCRWLWIETSPSPQGSLNALNTQLKSSGMLLYTLKKNIVLLTIHFYIQARKCQVTALKQYLFCN